MISIYAPEHRNHGFAFSYTALETSYVLFVSCEYCENLNLSHGPYIFFDKLGE